MVDQWSSLAALHPTGTFDCATAEGLFAIEVVYKEQGAAALNTWGGPGAAPPGTVSSLGGGFTLQWLSDAGPTSTETVPSERLLPKP